MKRILLSLFALALLAPGARAAEFSFKAIF